MRTDYVSIMDSGKRLNSAEARRLETSTISDSENIETHIRLIGYYWQRHNQRLLWIKHVVWLVANNPENPILFWPESFALAVIYDDLSIQLKSAWEQALDSRQQNIQVLRNAASFFCAVKTDRSLELILRARRLAPESAELRYECIVYLSILARQQHTPEELERMIIVNEELLAFEPDNLSILENLAQLTFKQSDFVSARNYASLIFDVENSSYLGHTILGLILLSEGAIGEAKKELLELEKTNGCGHHCFQFALAEALLERGERDAVCHYLTGLTQSWNFWPLEIGRILPFFWILMIRMGATPRLSQSTSRQIASLF